MTNYALISVYDKSNLKKICSIFKKYKIKIISSGTTGNYIRKLGFKCDDLSKYTKFKEILDGRVKTLHPKIHASILFKRQNKKHLKTFKKLNFPKISFLIVNLYPFKEFVKFSKDHEKTIKNAFQVLKGAYKFKTKNKLIVISGVFSDIFADAIQIRFLK